MERRVGSRLGLLGHCCWQHAARLRWWLGWVEALEGNSMCSGTYIGWYSWLGVSHLLRQLRMG